MTIDTNELRRLAQAVSEWSDCNQAWLDQSEGVPAAVVGHIDEDGTTYPIAAIDCDQYYAAHQSLPLAKFYAAANPAAVSELLNRIEAAENELVEIRHGAAVANDTIKALQAKIEQMEQQKPVVEVQWAAYIPNGILDFISTDGYLPKLGDKLYALPGAPEQEPTRDWWDCLIADISAVDCMYRGSPTYAHDAYWMRDHVVWMLKKRRDTLPGARTQGE